METHQPHQPPARSCPKAPSVADMLAACAAATELSTPPGGHAIPGVEPATEPQPTAHCRRKAA